MNQPQREAIFDFLLLAMFADTTLKLREDEHLYQLVAKLGWESSRTPEQYSQLGTARVRTAIESDGSIEPLLEKLSTRLGDDATRRKALELFGALIAADGAVVPAEHELALKARAAFGI